MSTSGTSTFSVTRDEIIKSSLRTLGVIGVGETPITEDYTNCSEALNIMIKSWAKKGFPLWVYNSVQVTMLTDLGVYPIGPTAAYVYSVTITAGGSGYPASGTLSFSSGAATATYTSTAGVISTITVTAGGNSYATTPTVTFSGGGTGAIGTVNLAGVTMPRPLRIIDAFIRNSEDIDTPLILISQQEYDILGNKASSGIPNQLYYDNQLINGRLYVYNVPSENGDVVYLTTQRMFEDMTSSSNTFDFPQEWFQALKWGLTAEIAIEYGVDIQLVPYYEQKALSYITEAFDWSVEESSVYFTMATFGSK